MGALPRTGQLCSMLLPSMPMCQPPPISHARTRRWSAHAGERGPVAQWLTHRRPERATGAENAGRQSLTVMQKKKSCARSGWSQPK